MLDAAANNTRSGLDRSVVVDARIRVREQPLTRILREADVVAVELQDGTTLEEALSASPDLMIVSLDADPLERLREIQMRCAERGLRLPVLGVARIGLFGTDFGSLRAAGLVGVIDSRTGPETVVARVRRQLGIGACGVQANERVQCMFPLVVSGGAARRRREFALNLSTSGMRLTTALPIELNSSIDLRFKLPMVDQRVIEATARTVHQTTHRNSWGRWEVGVFLTSIDPIAAEIIQRELGRLVTL
jgi:hypothetical protein